MQFTVVKVLQRYLQSIETTMTRRENVIRFLVIRTMLMGAMVIGFYLGIRHRIADLSLIHG